MEKKFKMLAKTFYGFEEILEKELRKLGAQNIKKGNRIVSFEGDQGFMYKANLNLRTCLRILKFRGSGSSSSQCLEVRAARVRVWLRACCR